MLAGFPAAYFCIKAFSETDLTEDLKRIDVPTLIIHGDDDQIVPIAASARRAVQLVENAMLEVTRAPRTACALPTRSGSTPISWPSSPPEDRARRLRGCEEIGFLHNHVLSIFLILKNTGFLEERFFHNL
jgi:fermentation-respiration switch protein FrsA (DUF1100 family)